jgi:hypothetical protein
MKTLVVLLTLVSIPAYAHEGFHGGGGGGFHGGGFHGGFDRGGGFARREFRGPFVAPGYACQWTAVPVTDDYGNIIGYNNECL